MTFGYVTVSYCNILCFIEKPYFMLNTTNFKAVFIKGSSFNGDRAKHPNYSLETRSIDQRLMRC